MVRDRILLRGLQYFVPHGAWEHEKLHGQKFVVDIDLRADFRLPGQTDRLDDALDYTEVYRLVKGVMEGRSANLLESLCHRIAVALLSRFACVDELGVRIEKPGASLGGIAGSVAVEVWRDRADVPGPTRTAYISIGSNMGDRHSFLCSAVALMAATRGIGVSALSGIYETGPVGNTDQPSFLNAVVGVETSQSPDELMMTLQGIEKRLGRVRLGAWGPRTLDADIISFGDERIIGEHLTIPHPRALERAFVMVPLAELNPSLVLGGAVTAWDAAASLDKGGVARTALVWPGGLIGPSGECMRLPCSDMGDDSR